MFEFLSLLVTGAGGGLLGGLGGLISKYIEQRNTAEIERIKLEQMKINNEYQLAQTRLEIEAGLSIVETTTNAELEKAGYDALKANFEFDKASYATGDKAKNSGWFVAVDFLRGVTRPLLTWVLDLFVLGIALYLIVILKDIIPTVAMGEGLALLKDIVTTILFLAATASGYWFSSRGHVPKKHT